MKRVLCALLVFALLAGMFAFAPAALDRDETTRLCDEIIAAELPRLRGFQLSNGAITMYDIRDGGRSKLTPYFSCSAALGLLAGGDTDAAGRYIQWHFDHLEEDGTIFDYTIDVEGENIKETSMNDCDSVDSYAALFLILLDEYAKAGGDMALLEAHGSDIARVVRAMDGVKQWGLTYAKPDYKAFYLMDNCEVAAGYRAAASLWGMLGNPLQALRCRLWAWCVTLAVNLRLWNRGRGCYDYALGNPSDLAVFYPDAAAQLFPVAFGLLKPGSSRAQNLYENFLEAQPQWLEGLGGGGFPWVILTRAALAMGDADTTAQYLRNVKALYIDGGPSGRWYCQESGLAVWAAAGLRNM